MSLINDVLKDLERRQAEPALPASTAAPAPRRRRRHGRLLIWLTVAVSAGIALHWLVAGQQSQPLLPDPIHAAMPEVRPARDIATRVEQTHVTAPDSRPESDTPGSSAAEPMATGRVTIAESETVATLSEPAMTGPAPAPSAPPEPQRSQPTASATQPGPPAADSTAERDDGDIVIRRADPAADSDADEQLAAARRALARNRHREAEQLIRALLESNPGRNEARLLLANDLLRRGDSRRAAELLADGLHAGDHPTELAHRLGRVLIERGETARARQVLQAHAPEAVADPDYHQLLAAAHRQAGDHDAALASYRQLSEVAPGRGAVWIGLGASLEALERGDEAVNAYRRALASDDVRAVRFARQRLHALALADGEQR